MNCKFCGTEISEGATFCAECGKPVAEPVAEQAAHQSTVAQTITAQPVAPKKPVDKKGLFNKVCLAVGTFLIVIGFFRLIDSSVSISSTSFGADFYTYAYKGIVACAEMLGKINATLSWCLIGIGAVIDIKAIKELFKN